MGNIEILANIKWLWATVFFPMIWKVWASVDKRIEKTEMNIEKLNREVLDLRSEFKADIEVLKERSAKSADQLEKLDAKVETKFDDLQKLIVSLIKDQHK